jgi:hypothetical protein
VKQPAVGRYVVRLGDEERERLDTRIQSGKAPARQLLKAQILLKADASEAGECKRRRENPSVKRPVGPAVPE